MTKSSEQENNVKWVYDLIARPISKVSGADVVKLVSLDQSISGFSRKKFFEWSGYKFNPVKQQFFFSDKDISKKSKEAVTRFLNKETLYIGYELSEQTRSLMDCLGYSYIDIWLHPVRFMDDVLFAFKSNIKKVNGYLKEFELDEELCYQHAAFLKVQGYKGFKRAKFQLENKSVLFVGQTLEDKAVFKDGKMLTVLDYKEQLERLSCSYSKVYYSRHPFVKGGDEDVISYLSEFNNVELIDKPCYEIIQKDEIEEVVTVSSSLATEAKFFGKKVQYFFKPPVPVYTDDGYFSIYNKFTCPNFWSVVLQSVFKTIDHDPLLFLSGKDKLRDSLSFYWGYRNIDKIEALKTTVGFAFNKKKALPVRRETFLDKLNDPTVKVVSFDIFDTLVNRAHASPRDIFRIAQEKISKVHEKGSFLYSARVKAENLAMELARSNGFQDTNFDEIYNELSNILNLTKEEEGLYKKIELDLEIASIKRRDAGLELFRQAVESKKVVLLISDMYLSKHFLVKQLEKLGIEGYYEIFVSSEIRKRKHEGDLYSYVLNEYEINADNLLHVGDNVEGDIKSASRLGIKTHHIPRAIANLEQMNPSLFFTYRDGVKARTVTENAYIGQYVNRYLDDHHLTRIKGSRFNKDKVEFGYIGLGPIICSFADWIKRKAIDDGVDKLLFLSRDGKVVLDVYKTLFGDDECAPVAEYVYASRRSARVQGVVDDSYINDALEKFIYSMPISRYLANNFGLEKEDYDEEYLKKFGLEGYEHSIGNKFDKNALKSLVFGLKEKIFSRASAERSAYKDYLSAVCSGSKKVAVVDIGYAGSMQAHMSKILDASIYGYYYATFNSALNNLDAKYMDAYLANFAIPASLQHTLSSHRFVYESLFCSGEGSFVKCRKIDDGYDFVFDGQERLKRSEIVEKIHDGVRLLASDIKSNVLEVQEHLEWSAFSSCRYLDAFIKTPSKPDTDIVAGIEFVDGYGPSSIRYLVPPAGTDFLTYKSTCIWKEAISAIEKSLTIKPLVKKQSPKINVSKNLVTSENKEKVSVDLVKVNDVCLSDSVQDLCLSFTKTKSFKVQAKLFRVLLSESKYNKYTRDPKKFYMDSKYKFLQNYGRRIDSHV